MGAAKVVGSVLTSAFSGLALAYVVWDGNEFLAGMWLLVSFQCVLGLVDAVMDWRRDRRLRCDES